MTSGVGVKPALLPFEGRAFHDSAAAAVPRSACAAAAHTLAPSPPSTDLSGPSVGRSCVCVSCRKNRPYLLPGGPGGA